MANLSYRVDDAQSLRTFSEASVDIAVSQMAIMDIPDHQAMFQSIHRVLKTGGVFIFTLLHPCFETPFHIPDQLPFLFDESGDAIAYVIHRYASEGFWKSGGDGVRGRVGAYHRTLSTLLNDLLAAGFLLEKLDEPVTGKDGLFSQVPRVLLVAARAT
jgi:SAM-dependent methyltransferase